MNTRTGLLVLALFSCLSAPMTLVAASLEEEYFETRDNFIRQFEKASTPIDDRPALAELEKQLKAIVGPVNYKHQAVRSVRSSSAPIEPYPRLIRFCEPILLFAFTLWRAT